MQYKVHFRWNVGSRSIAVATLAVCTVSSFAALPKYKVTALGTLDYIGATPTGLNEKGQVVGWCGTQSGQNHAFLYSGGKMTDLGTLGGNGSYGYGINASGQVVGSSRNAAGQDHGFLFAGGTMVDLTVTANVSRLEYARAINDAGQVVGYGRGKGYLISSGTATDLGSLGMGGTEANAINELGHVVGESLNPGQRLHAYLYSKGAMQDLGTLGGNRSWAYAVNDLDQVVGYSETADGKQRAFVWSGISMLDVGTLGGTASWAYGINNSGQIVGRSFDSTSNTRAFVFSNNTMYDLNSLLMTSIPTLTNASAINDRGQIAAQDKYGNGYLLTPVPEPASLAVLGFGIVPFLKRRRK